MSLQSGQQFIAYVDAYGLSKIIDYEYKWVPSYNKKVKSYYARAVEYVSGSKIGKPVYMHRMICGATDCHIKVDHINHDTLNNRMNNFRVTDNSSNSRNRKGKNSNNKSGYRNVCWIYNKWVVQLMIDGKNTTLGKFDDVHEAGLFAEEMRKKYYGEYAGNS